MVYPRALSTDMVKKSGLESIKLEGDITQVNAPIFELSATFIRQGIKQGKDVRPMVPERVWQYIDEMNFYK